MSYCEICGEKIVGTPREVVVGGVKLLACPRCAKGLASREHRPKTRKLRPRVGATLKRGPDLEMDLDEDLIVPDYASIIRKARESLGLTQEQLGRLINEKPSVIRRIESGAMVPTPVIARKLERALKIRLIQE